MLSDFIHHLITQKSEIERDEMGVAYVLERYFKMASDGGSKSNRKRRKTKDTVLENVMESVFELVNNQLVPHRILSLLLKIFEAVDLQVLYSVCTLI